MYDFSDFEIGGAAMFLFFLWQSEEGKKEEQGRRAKLGPERQLD
jgi:hypothetical protein